MKKSEIIIIIFVLLSVKISAQQVVATSGGFLENANGSVSFTIGEPVTATLQNDEVTLTQGFQQPYDFHYTQLLNLPQGWSGVSSYIIPNAAQVDQLFTNVESDMIILQNFSGMYWPTAGVNTLGSWDDHEGYQVKMEAAQQVTFSGSMQDNLTANLNEGWNYLPVLNACDNDADELLSQIIGNLQIVKEVAGYGVYWPQFGIKTLGLLEPGKAYFVLVDADVSLEFPECGLKQTACQTFQTLSGFETQTELGIRQTPLTHSIAFPRASYEGLTEGDIIGVPGMY